MSLETVCVYFLFTKVGIPSSHFIICQEAARSPGAWVQCRGFWVGQVLCSRLCKDPGVLGKDSQCRHRALLVIKTAILGSTYLFPHYLHSLGLISNAPQMKCYPSLCSVSSQVTINNVTLVSFSKRGRASSWAEVNNKNTSYSTSVTDYLWLLWRLNVAKTITILVSLHNDHVVTMSEESSTYTSASPWRPQNSLWISGHTEI